MDTIIYLVIIVVYIIFTIVKAKRNEKDRPKENPVDSEKNSGPYSSQEEEAEDFFSVLTGEVPAPKPERIEAPPLPLIRQNVEETKPRLKAEKMVKKAAPEKTVKTHIVLDFKPKTVAGGIIISEILSPPLAMRIAKR